ncbi:hypothetical protein ACP4OV_018115 [Aristida adscensionis]
MSRALGMGSELSSQADLLQGYVELYHHGLLHVKSAALGCAVGLGIPTAIHRGGGAATAPDLAADAGVDPAKLPYLRRLMRALTVSGVFATSSAGGVADEPVFTLTPVSRLLVVDERSAADGMSAMLRLLVRPSTSVATFFSLEAWFRDAGAGSAATTMTLFETAHGVPAWSMTKSDVAYNKALNDGCAADSSFAMDVILKEAVVEGGNNIFAGLSSLVDVGGGHGAAAVAITRAFPHIKCSVLDLEQVIREAPDDGTVRFIAGDMFQSVPPADAVLLNLFCIVGTMAAVLRYFASARELSPREMPEEK